LHTWEGFYRLKRIIGKKYRQTVKLFLDRGPVDKDRQVLPFDLDGRR
jgi:hypothetical protein